MSRPSAGFLSGVHALLVEQGVGKARKRILSRQLEEKGGTTTDKISEDGITHIIVGSTVKLSRLTHLLKVDRLPEVPVVRADWLSSCLVAGEKLGIAPHLVQPDIPSPLKAAGVQVSLLPQKSPKVRWCLLRRCFFSVLIVISCCPSLVRARLACRLNLKLQLVLKYQPQTRKTFLLVKKPRPQRCGLE